MAQSLDQLFIGVDDPRVKGRCLYRLKDILFIAFCTLLSNGEDFEYMVEFGHQRYDWLNGKLDLSNGIPSHDTFNRVLQIVDPEQLISCLEQDGQILVDSLEGQLVTFDGKKMRGASPKS